MCVLVAALVLGTASLFAQTTTGTLRGTVRDTSGAVLPGATVEVTGAAGTQTAVADANGQYRFQALTPGVYTLKATLDGFKTIVMEGLRVEVGRTFDVDLRLEVGAVAETVTVSGESPLIDTSQSAVTINYNQELIQDTPVLRFSVFDYFQMTPGIASTQVQDSHDLLGVRVEHQRKPVPDRRHQHHRRPRPARCGPIPTPTSSPRWSWLALARPPNTATCRARCSTSSPRAAATR